MATAKLWWNGSSWKTSETTCVNKTTYGNFSLGVKQEFQVVAYDDFSIKTILKLTGTASGAIYIGYVLSGTVTVKGGSTTVGTLSASGDSCQGTYTVTSYTKASYSGTVTVRGAGGEPHVADIDISDNSDTYTSPFYTVSYNANGGSGAPSSNKGVKGFSTKVANGTPTRSGWTFKGWATSNTATSATYQAGDTIPERSSNLTLYAVWYRNITITAPEGVTISFGGTNYTNQTVTVQKAYGTYALSMTAQPGWIIKTRSPAASVTQVVITKDGTTPSNISAISATSQRVGCHIDDGNQWVQAVMYMDTGNDWVMVQAYVDDGNSWKLVY